MKKLLIIIILLCSYEGFTQAKDTLFVENGHVWYSSKYGSLIEGNKDVYRDFFPAYDKDGLVTIWNNNKRVLKDYALSGLFLNGSGAVTDAQKRAWLESKKIGFAVSSSCGSALPTGASTSALQTAGNASLTNIDAKLTNNATTTLQTAGNASLTNIDTKLTNIDTKLTNNATTTLQTAGNVSLATIATNTTPVISTNAVQELRITTAVSGTIASGARFISVANIDTANATFNGEVFVAGEESTYPIILNTTYPAINYVGAVGAILKIIIIR